ncbi:DUF4340 domain-containing protein [Pedosphaera parvula]|uniref:DUF4340 domain-containing protein n=1 Tax=Pedosphaera parvula (strain Ellin514) TaxID=320771 RepID=B9XF34_PEDPL|nr:DUF4340 domain-containing protein [Pedosphaera parvula]EEF61532.1 hypothetical protein Cflav_PD4210 [Pedosphaera parvula Ellin514]
MNPKNTWILIFVTAGMFAFIFFIERHQRETTPSATKALVNFKAASITSIQIQPAGQLEMRATRTNGSWQLTKPITYPAQSVAIESLLRALETLSVQIHIPTQELRKNPKAEEEFGFETPQVTVILQEGNNRHSPIKFGFLTAPGDQVYLQVVGTEGIDVVSSDIIKLLPRTLNEWRDTNLLSLKGLTFDRLAVTNGGRSFELSRASNRLWRITYPMPARADSSRVEGSLARLESARVSRFVTDDPAADLETYGLKPAEFEVTLSQGTNPVLALQFGKSPTNDSKQIFAMVKGQPAIVEIPKEFIAPWRARYEEFRDRRLAGPVPLSLETIEVHQSDKSTDFTIQKQSTGAWRVNEPYNFPADPETMLDLIDGLSGLEIVPAAGQFAVKDVVSASDFPKYGLANPVRKYILKEGMTKDKSNPTNVVLAELDFGSTFEDKIYARRADRPDEDSVYAVKQVDFERLPSKALQLRDRHIWNFTPADVSSVTVRNDGSSVKMIRKAENQWSLASGSQGIVDNFAVEAGADELGSLEAGSWIDCGDQNLAKYGISDKSTQVSVEVRSGNQNQTLVLDLGGWSPSQHRYGAVRLEGQTWVFEFPTRIVERILYDFNIHEKPAS